MSFKLNPITGLLDLVGATSTGSGLGDVVGPSASTDNNFAIFDGTTGKLLKDSDVKGSDFQSVTATNINYATATHTTISVVTVSATSLASLNLSTTNLIFTKITGTTVTATSLASLNISTTNLTFSTATGTTVTATNLNGQAIDVATITATSLGTLNISTTNLTSTLVSATNVNFSGATILDSNINTNADLLLQGFSFIIDGGTETIGNGTVKGFALIPFNATVTNLYLIADQTGNIAIDIWKSTYSDTNLPTDGNSIFGSVVFSLSNAQAMSLSSGFTGSIIANDVIRFNVDSCTTITNCTVGISMRKT